MKTPTNLKSVTLGEAIEARTMFLGIRFGGSLLAVTQIDPAPSGGFHVHAKGRLGRYRLKAEAPNEVCELTQPTYSRLYASPCRPRHV